MNKLKELSDSGVDIAKGLFCCSDDMDLYLEMLSMFIKEKGNVVVQLNAEFNKGDIKALKDISHGLKGVSGTIGAFEIGYIAEQLEFSCVDECDNEEIKNLITELADNFNPVMEVLKNYEEIGKLKSVDVV